MGGQKNLQTPITFYGEEISEGDRSPLNSKYHKVSKYMSISSDNTILTKL